MRMSKSKILTFLQCSEKFRLQYILNLGTNEEPEEGSPLKVGLDLHQIFEDYYTLPEAGTVETEDDIFNLLLQHPLAHKEDKEIEKKYHLHLANFAAYNYHELKEKGLEKYIPPERELDLFDDKLRLRGIIDRVEYGNNGGMNVIDYKTGRMKSLKHYTLELSLYKILYERYSGNTVDMAGIYFSQNGKLRLTEISKEDETRSLQIMENVRKKVAQKQFVKSPGFLCNYCEFEKICQTDQYY